MLGLWSDIELDIRVMRAAHATSADVRYAIPYSRRETAFHVRVRVSLRSGKFFCWKEGGVHIDGLTWMPVSAWDGQPCRCWWSSHRSFAKSLPGSPTLCVQATTRE